MKFCRQRILCLEGLDATEDDLTVCLRVGFFVRRVARVGQAGVFVMRAIRRQKGRFKHCRMMSVIGRKWTMEDYWLKGLSETSTKVVRGWADRVISRETSQTDQTSVIRDQSTERLTIESTSEAHCRKSFALNRQFEQSRLNSRSGYLCACLRFDGP